MALQAREGARAAKCLQRPGYGNAQHASAAVGAGATGRLREVTGLGPLSLRYDCRVKRPLNSRQQEVLQYIEGHPGCTSTSAGDELMMDNVAFRRIAEGLYARNLVTREQPKRPKGGAKWRALSQTSEA
jgi:hypothetical protein